MSLSCWDVDSTSLDVIPIDADSRERDRAVDGSAVYPQIAGRALTEAAGDTRLRLSANVNSAAFM
jgi:hypothetical protein